VDIQNFIKKVAEQYDETDSVDFKPDTEFKKLVDWSSMVALSIIAMVDDEYDIIIEGDDIRNSETIEDLFNIVKAYKPEV
jgi:acyl carrier protein